jgi:hypothetical protein
LQPSPAEISRFDGIVEGDCVGLYGASDDGSIVGLEGI